MIRLHQYRHQQLTARRRRQLEGKYADLMETIARRADRLAPTVVRVWKGEQRSAPISEAIDAYLGELGELQKIEDPVRVNLSCWLSADKWRAFEEAAEAQKLTPEQAAGKAIDLFLRDSSGKSLKRRTARRQGATERIQAIIKVGVLTVDFGRRRVERDGEAIPLTKTRFEILALLVKKLGQVVPSETILDSVWGPNAGDLQTLRIHISQIRKKIEPDPASPRYLVTAHKVGYQFQDPSESASFSASAWVEFQFALPRWWYGKGARPTVRLLQRAGFVPRRF